MNNEEIIKAAIPKALKIIEGYEGLSGWSVLKQRFFPIQEPADRLGVLTIGKGHVCSAKEIELWSKEGLTRQQVEELFQKDLAPRIVAVDKLLKGKYTADQFAALLSLYYNNGEEAFYKSPGEAFQRGNFRYCAERMLLYINSNKKPVLGLWRRRATEALCLLTGKVLVAKNPITEKLLFMELDKLKINYVKPKF